MAAKQVPSISLTIDNSSRDQKLRSTLQPHSLVTNDIRPRAHSYTQLNKVSVSRVPIIEVDENESSVNGGSRKTSFVKNPASRNNSVSSKRGRIVDLSGFDNGGFVGKTSTNNNFNRGYIDSARSSVHDGLHIQREQYCCLSRWSPFEKRLAISVGILAVVILALVIAVGFLAKPDEKAVTIQTCPSVSLTYGNQSGSTTIEVHANSCSSYTPNKFNCNQLLESQGGRQTS